MRFRAGILLCLFALVLGVGCRKPLTPADNNQAPETWITSAPQDTLTVKDDNGHPIVNQPGTIPVAYHLENERPQLRSIIGGIIAVLGVIGLILLRHFAK